MGPQLVQHLQGSQYAKERLELILETITGNLTIPEACQRMGIGEAMFHRLRIRVLQVGLSDLEPRAPGRPRRLVDASELEKEALAAELDTLQDELKIAEIRQELATIMSPAQTSSSTMASGKAAPKKTTSRQEREQRHKELRRRQSKSKHRRR
jgi:hypothetical protein